MSAEDKCVQTDRPSIFVYFYLKVPMVKPLSFEQEDTFKRYLGKILDTFKKWMIKNCLSEPIHSLLAVIYLSNNFSNTTL